MPPRKAAETVGNKPATISDVARLAGVAVGTASKALNGRGSLSAQTRQRVLSAAEELGFQPNKAAVALNSGRTYTVGMITTDTIGRFSIPLLMGAEDALGAGEMSVFLCDARDDPIREQYYLKTLLSRRVDGIIVTGRRTQARPPLGAGLPIPVVYAFISSTDAGDCSVVPDEAGGARRAVDHLLDIGRRRIAHITGPEHHHSATVRAEATLERLASAGADLVGPPLFGEWSEAWGRQAVRMLLGAGREFDAVFCGSDQIARGVADALRAAGRVVPDDVALVGFDNWDVMALACQPALTSVDMELEGLGRTAANLLLAAINGEPAPGRHTHPCRLVVRDSTAVPIG
jgi:LacI family transcriptional regulator